jgi:hypothetical protein
MVMVATTNAYTDVSSQLATHGIPYKGELFRRRHVVHPQIADEVREYDHHHSGRNDAEYVQEGS